MLNIEYMPLADLLGRRWEHNPKSHDIGTLLESFGRFGFVAPVILDEATGKLVAGHGRLEALARAKAAGEGPPERIAVEDGDWLVPVVRGAAFGQGEADAYAIADNQLTVGSGYAPAEMWDLDGLAMLLQGLQDGPGLTGTGFDDDSLAKLLEELGQAVPPKDEDFDVGAALKNQVEPRIKRGEVWQLGRHRLMCGDSTNAEDVAKLMGGEKASMLMADPPYGMALEADWSSLKGDEAFEERYGKRYEKVIGDDKAFDPGPIMALWIITEQFWWGADYYRARLPEGGSWLVWDKREGERDSDAMIGSGFELCWSARKHKREIIRKLWAGYYGLQSQDTKTRIHPTQKPVEVIGWLLERYSEREDIIADPFLGSGTTIIAAEQLGRRAFGMEISEAYCTVALDRWEAFTGEKAVRAE